MNYTIKQFHKEFPNDEACLEYIFKSRFPNIKCPKCGKDTFYRVNNRKVYACSCGYQINPIANTIFHKSATKLTDWLFAIYLMSQSKNGVSAKEIQRHLGTTYKTAWRIGKLIRSLMSQENEMLNKTVEADEVYIGGRRKMSKKGEKETVLGMVQRDGKIKAQHIKEYWIPTAMKSVSDNIERGTRVITDESSILDKVKRMGYLHDTIKHRDKVYARGDIHTNTIEGAWSQLKRGLFGTYHSVSKKYLQSYINEFCFSYNSRFSSVSPFQTLILRLCERHDLGENKISLFPVVVIS
ncbi:MAG: IS1595 family transposase [bacterium]